MATLVFEIRQSAGMNKKFDYFELAVQCGHVQARALVVITHIHIELSLDNVHNDVHVALGGGSADNCGDNGIQLLAGQFLPHGPPDSAKGVSVLQHLVVSLLDLFSQFSSQIATELVSFFGQ